MKRLLFFSIVLLTACKKEINIVRFKDTNLSKSSANAITGTTVIFVPQTFYWSKGTSISNTQSIKVSWEATGESQLSSYDLQSNRSGSYVRLATISSSGTDILTLHSYIDNIPKNSANYYYRLIYHFINGTSSIGVPMLVDLKQRSSHICLKPSCWP